MKKKLLLLPVLFFTVAVYAQVKAKIFERKEVKSVQWGTQSVAFINGYWDMALPQLEKKFTKALADSIYYFSSSVYKASWLDTDEGRETAKMYLVASYNNNFRGTFHGVEYVVMVPYEENKNQHYGEIKRDFFFVFPKEAVILK